MVTSFIFLSLLFFCQIVKEEACRWSVNSVDHHYHTTLWQSFGKGRHKNKPPREHWNVPENMKGDYGQWIAEYMTNKSIEDKKNEEMASSGDGKIPGLDVPTSWQGYGVGNGGVDPPPWAIIPFAYGKPEICFLEPEIGHCTQKIARWGYNSYHATCHQFVYSGCGGNQNNFRTRKRCEESCVHEIQSNCQKYGEYIEY